MAIHQHALRPSDSKFMSARNFGLFGGENRKAARSERPLSFSAKLRFRTHGLTVDLSVQWVIYAVHLLHSARLVRINLRTGHSDSLSTGCSYVEYPSCYGTTNG